MHLGLKFADAMIVAGSGADLEATKRGSHKLRELRRAGAHMQPYLVLLGRNPSIKLCLGWKQRHSESPKLTHQGESATVQGAAVPRAAAQKRTLAQGRSDLFATSPGDDRSLAHSRHSVGRQMFDFEAGMQGERAGCFGHRSEPVSKAAPYH